MLFPSEIERRGSLASDEMVESAALFRPQNSHFLHQWNSKRVYSCEFSGGSIRCQILKLMNGRPKVVNVFDGMP
jgi:hypothetical protein